jgi:hypothetical protein
MHFTSFADDAEARDVEVLGGPRLKESASLSCVQGAACLLSPSLATFGACAPCQLASRRAISSSTSPARMRPDGASVAMRCHHNYVAKERHFGADVYVTRKGAVRAGLGELGINPARWARARWRHLCHDVWSLVPDRQASRLHVMLVRSRVRIDSANLTFI